MSGKAKLIVWELYKHINSIYAHNERVEYIDKGWDDVMNHTFFKYHD